MHHVPQTGIPSIVLCCQHWFASAPSSCGVSVIAILICLTYNQTSKTRDGAIGRHLRLGSSRVAWTSGVINESNRLTIGARDAAGNDKQRIHGMLWITWEPTVPA